MIDRRRKYELLMDPKRNQNNKKKSNFQKKENIKTNVDKVRRWEERGREWTVEDVIAKRKLESSGGENRKKGTRRLLGYFAWPAYASSYLYVEDVVAWFRVGTRQCGASLAGEGFHLRQHVCNVRALHCCIR